MKSEYMALQVDVIEATIMHKKQDKFGRAHKSYD